jgi:hypothetical protein
MKTRDGVATARTSGVAMDVSREAARGAAGRLDRADARRARARGARKPSVQVRCRDPIQTGVATQSKVTVVLGAATVASDEHSHEGEMSTCLQTDISGFHNPD